MGSPLTIPFVQPESVSNPANGAYETLCQRILTDLVGNQIAVYPMELGPVVGGLKAVAHFQVEDVLAEATGGKAFHNNNDKVLMLSQAVRHGGHYYAISYNSNHMQSDNGLRTIQVLLARRGKFEMNYRRFYYAMADSKYDGLDQPSMEEVLGMGHATLRGVLFSARLTQLGEPHPVDEKSSGSEVVRSYLIQYGIHDDKLKKEAMRRNVAPELEFAVAAFDADGKLLTLKKNEGIASADAEEDGTFNVRFHAEQTIDVPQTATTLRLAVRDMPTGSMGTVEISLNTKMATTTF